jgi:arylsulfatase A-like enzyme
VPQAVRPLADVVGVRPLVGIPVRRGRPVRPDHHAGQLDTRVPEGDDGKQYYFPDDITDKAVEWLNAVRAQDSDRPWMMFYSTGCAHAPHHVAPEWADRYKGKFDDGWDELRKRTLARQKELGIVPQDAELTERPDAFPAWDSLTETQKALYVRQMEVYAGYQENADWNVGRLLDAIETLGDLDNTLIRRWTRWWSRSVRTAEPRSRRPPRSRTRRPSAPWRTSPSSGSGASTRG